MKACGRSSKHKLVASVPARRSLNDSVVAAADYNQDQTEAGWEILNDDDDGDQISKTKAFEEAALIEIDRWTDAIDYLRDRKSVV